MDSQSLTEEQREPTSEDIKKVEQNRNKYHNGGPTPYESSVQELTDYISLITTLN